MRTLLAKDGFDVLTTSGDLEAVTKDKGEFAGMLKTLQQGRYMAAATYRNRVFTKSHLMLKRSFTVCNLQRRPCEMHFVGLVSTLSGDQWGLG